jgi:hypothetical protein
MMKFRTIANVLCVAGMSLWLAGCAEMQSTSTRLGVSPQKIDSLAVWSEVGSLVYAKGPVSPSKPFPETFRQSLAAALSAQGIAITYQEVQDPGRMSKRELAQLHAQDNPNAKARLVIQVASVRTMTSPRYAVEKAVYRLTLVSTATDKPLWQAQISAFAGLDIPPWNESTAAKFANEIVALLKKDTVI